MSSHTKSLPPSAKGSKTSRSARRANPAALFSLDFSKMEFDPTELGGLMLWEKYRKIARKKNLRRPPEIEIEEDDDYDGLSDLDDPQRMGDSDWNDVLRFVILFVDNRNNPLADIMDFDERAKAAIDSLMPQPGTRKFLEDLWMTDHWSLRRAIFEYFRLIGADDYTTWFALKMQALQVTKLLMSEMPTGEKAHSIVRARDAASDNLPKLMRQISELEMKLFRSEDLRSLVYDSAVSDGLGSPAERKSKEYKPMDFLLRKYSKNLKFHYA